MPNPVSFIRWHDTETDPPTGEPRLLIVERPDGKPSVADSAGSWRDLRAPLFTRWAELPVVSDLTDDDVRNIAVWALDGETLTTDGSHDTVDRLRAALGGEKEET